MAMCNGMKARGLSQANQQILYTQISSRRPLNFATHVGEKEREGEREREREREREQATKELLVYIVNVAINFTSKQDEFCSNKNAIQKSKDESNHETLKSEAIKNFSPMRKLLFCPM